MELNKSTYRIGFNVGKVKWRNGETWDAGRLWKEVTKFQGPGSSVEASLDCADASGDMSFPRCRHGRY